jgi:hypothetical protein
MDDSTSHAPLTVDLDVFSTYKSEHQWGLRFSERLVCRPWLDTEWYISGSLTTNEQLKPWDPDNLRLHCGWKQLIGPVQADLGYRYNHYFDDSDRNGATDRNFLDFALAWDQWLISQERLQLSLKTEIDLDRSQLSGWLAIAWFFGEGRGLRDFGPGDGDFPTIRERRIPHIRNNRMIPVIPGPRKSPGS